MSNNHFIHCCSQKCKIEFHENLNFSIDYIVFRDYEATLRILWIVSVFRNSPKTELLRKPQQSHFSHIFLLFWIPRTKSYNTVLLKSLQKQETLRNLHQDLWNPHQNLEGSRTVCGIRNNYLYSFDAESAIKQMCRQI